MLRRFVADEKLKADLVPIDITVNMILAACWRVVHTPKHKPPVVYNCVSSVDNPFFWGKWLSLTLKNTVEYPHDSVFRTPYCSFVRATK